MENWQCRRLISLYKEYKCLWDSNDTNYTNRGVRDDAWRHISREMNYPVETLKKKMKSLSGGYRREKFREKQSQKTGSGAGDIYKSKWFAYEDFAFMADKNDPGKTKDILQNFPETAIPETPDADEQAGIRRRSLLPLIKRSEEIIARVYNYLQAEYEELKSSLDPSVDLSPLANILKRTAAATGISEHTVSAILAEERKRLAEDERDAGTAKRAKLSHDAGDGGASPIIDDESSCEAPDKEQDDDNEQTQDDSQERNECIVETLKVEIEDETYYRPSDPLQSQVNERNSAAEHQLVPITNIANVTIKTEPVEVKIEPIDTEYSQFSSGVVPVTSLPRVKTEPDDDSHSSTARESDVVSATLCDVTSVKSEPPS